MTSHPDQPKPKRYFKVKEDRSDNDCPALAYATQTPEIAALLFVRECVDPESYSNGGEVRLTVNDMPYIVSVKRCAFTNP